jgi:hypothetical protein
MLRLLIGAFIILHGLVHLLYFGQGWRLFELQPGLIWPDGSWAFSKLLGDGTARLLASVLCVLAAIGFVTSGIGILAGQAWWHSAIVVVALFSAAIFFLFWNGELKALDGQGAIAILINLVLVPGVFIVRWLNFQF